jgi:hypothetical protein
MALVCVMAFVLLPRNPEPPVRRESLKKFSADVGRRMAIEIFCWMQTLRCKLPPGDGKNDIQTQRSFM